ncbi:hypothetical protein DUNSADRAFT_14975 [Dunaliella salina]|uniref:Uncharacterized protein n=1 Tax=Dunaliella salina TaxID=3046 RepID=A0ABQ7H261_DUNSA|nr:hypothetical protein DUNSADRAFT_14975 [Dunaliella salina]|eukprot:KAF5840951.1 hypothetical protein DUNSADRAFT_14975 [Dunaliella salina]
MQAPESSPGKSTCASSETSPGSSASDHGLGGPYALVHPLPHQDEAAAYETQMLEDAWAASCQGSSSCPAMSSLEPPVLPPPQHAGSPTPTPASIPDRGGSSEQRAGRRRDRQSRSYTYCGPARYPSGLSGPGQLQLRSNPLADLPADLQADLRKMQGEMRAKRERWEQSFTGRVLRFGSSSLRRTLTAMSSLSQLAQGRAGTTDKRGSHSSPNLLQQIPYTPPWQQHSQSANDGLGSSDGVGSARASGTGSDVSGKHGTCHTNFGAQGSEVQGHTGAVSRDDLVVQRRGHLSGDCSNVAGAGAAMGSWEQGDGGSVEGGALNAASKRSRGGGQGCKGPDTRTYVSCSTGMECVQGREGVQTGGGSRSGGNVECSSIDGPPENREANVLELLQADPFFISTCSML